MFIALKDSADCVHHANIVPLFSLFEIVQTDSVQPDMRLLPNGRFRCPAHMLLCNQHIFDNKIYPRLAEVL